MEIVKNLNQWQSDYEQGWLAQDAPVAMIRLNESAED